MTARPDGSAISAKDFSQAIAVGVEQAIDGPSGTIATVWSPGKWDSKIERQR